MKGRGIGLILVIVAYIAGLFVLISTVAALVILVLVVITRYLAPGCSLKKNS